MSSPENAKVEKIKLWQVMLGLATAIISLIIAIIALVPKEPAKPTEESSTSSSLVETVSDKKPHSPVSDNTTAPKKIESKTPSYDTLKVYLPSKFQVQEVKIDGDPATIYKQTPTAAWLRFQHKESNRQLLFIGKSQQCTVSQYFRGSKTIAVTLSDCQ